MWDPLPRVMALALIFALLSSSLSYARSTAGHYRDGKNEIAGVDLAAKKPAGPRKLGPGNSTDNGKADAVGTERMGDSCAKDDIVVYQGETAPLPNGIPTYTVEILNVCLSGCAVSDIHVSCGWFSSARLINPRVFRRIGFDDCLVNDGAALGPGESLSFQYANTYRYPLYVSSVSCYAE